MKIFTLILVFFVCLKVAYSKVIVTPGAPDTVNFTHVLFDLPGKSTFGATEFTIVKQGTKDTIRSKAYSRELLIDSGLAFGDTYIWSYTCFDKNGAATYRSASYNLTIAGQAVADTAMYRYQVSAGGNHKGMVLLDMGVIIDKQGNPVWTFPPGQFGAVRCLDMTREANLTFLHDGAGYETDIRGNILWKTPDSIPGYGKVDFHHEFKKLYNGNYLGIATAKNTGGDKLVYSMLLEVNREGKVAWCVDEKEWYKNDTAFKGSHMNAAWYDEYRKKVYISFRDLHAIVCVDVTTGKLDYSIGYDFKDGTPYYPQNFFNGQHAVSITDDKKILLFNNNTLYPAQSSSIIELSLPKAKKSPWLLWQYSFNFPDAKYNKAAKQGGVIQLDNGNLLVCMGANSKVIEVNKKKQIVWELDVLKCNTARRNFVPMPTGYRAAYCHSLYPPLD